MSYEEVTKKLQDISLEDINNPSQKEDLNVITKMNLLDLNNKNVSSLMPTFAVLNTEKNAYQTNQNNEEKPTSFWEFIG